MVVSNLKLCHYILTCWPKKFYCGSCLPKKNFYYKMLIAWIAKHRKTLVFEDKQVNVHDIANQFDHQSKANKQTYSKPNKINSDI